MPATTVRVKPPGDNWMVLGVDVAPGILPEGVSLTANEAGPDTCSFTLRRDSTLPWRDLLPFAELEVEVAGAGVVWGGRVWDTSYADKQTIGVTARGWQYALDDNQMMRLWVHDRLGDWADGRTTPGQNLAYWTQAGNIQSGGQVQIGWANGGPYFQNQACGVIFDSGVTAGIKGIYVRATSTNLDSANYGLIVRGTDTPYTHFGSGEDASYWETSYGFGSGALSNAWTSATNATGKRYAAVLVYMPGAGSGTRSRDEFLTIHEILVVRDTGYVSSNASILKASDVIKDVRSALLGSVLSTDETLITTSSTSIPHLTTESGYQTPRQILQACNAYHDWLLGVGADKRLFFTARPTEPVIEIGEWSGADFADAGDSGEELYNRVLVTGTGPDGLPLLVERTATSSVLDAAGITRSKSLSVNAATTTSIAQVIGDAWLATRSARPTRGSVTIRGTGGARGVTSGAPVNPAETLRYPGQRMRLSHRWDPDTGAWGRDASITSVTYTPATDTAVITLDSPRDRLDVLLGRLAAVRGAGQPLQ